MEKGLKLKLTAGVAGGLAAVAAGSAIAATQLGSPKADNEAIVNDAAKQLGVQPSALSSALKRALENRVDAAVAAGRLSKAEGEAIKKEIESGNAPLFAGPGPRFDHHFGPGPGHDAAAAKYLGLTRAQLRSKLESGKSLAQVAKAQGKSVSGLKQAMIASAKSQLDKAVSAGRLTKAQETRILAEIKQHLSMLVNGTAPRFSFRHGPRPGFGFRTRQAPPPGAAWQ